MEFESTTQYFCNKYDWSWNFDFQIWTFDFNYLDLKFVFSDRKKFLVESLIDIFQFIQFFRNFRSHIESEILSFVI